MINTDSFFEEMYLFWRGILYGNDKVTSIFSYKGTLTRSLGWATAVILYFMTQTIGWLNSEVISYIANLMICYCTLALIQKRCRDFGSKGTFWILAYSVAFTVAQAFQFTDINELEPLWRNVCIVAQDCQLIILFLLFLIPSKKDADLELRSPLLKYPFVYMGICWLAAIGATLVINHYFSI